MMHGEVLRKVVLTDASELSIPQGETAHSLHGSHAPSGSNRSSLTLRAGPSGTTKGASLQADPSLLPPSSLRELKNQKNS